MAGAWVSRARLQAADGMPMPTKQTSVGLSARDAAIVIISVGVYSAMGLLARYCIRQEGHCVSVPSPDWGGGSERPCLPDKTLPSPSPAAAACCRAYLANASGPASSTLVFIQARKPSRSRAIASHAL